VKERLALKGDVKEPPMEPHYLTFVNNFAKWDRQVQIGKLPLPPMDLVRHELEPVLKRLIALVGRDWARDTSRKRSKRWRKRAKKS
jgi:hypothetical protein